MRDMGLVKNSEPAERLFTQGMVIKGGAKMSKSLGNVVSPDDMVARYGADSTRMYTLFAAPPDRDLDWQDAGVEGISRFLSRVYRFVARNAKPDEPASDSRRWRTAFAGGAQDAAQVAPDHPARHRRLRRTLALQHFDRGPHGIGERALRLRRQRAARRAGRLRCR